MKNKALLLPAYFIGIFFAAGFLLALGTHKASADTCSTQKPGFACIDTSVVTGATGCVTNLCPDTPPSVKCCKPPAISDAPAPVLPTGAGGTTFTNPLEFTTVEGFLGGILSAIQKIIVVLALVFITIGAVMILTSAGNSGMVEQGKGAITMALVGLALGVAAPSLLKELSNIIGWGQGSDIEALTLSEIAVNVLNFLLGTMGILALVMLVVGAIMYLTSAGDEDRIDKGKEIFKYSLIGVILAMSSMVLVTQIARFFITTTPSPSTATNASGGGALAAPSTCPVGDFSCIGGGAFGSVTQASCTAYQVGSVVNTNGTNCCSSNDYACLDT